MCTIPIISDLFILNWDFGLILSLVFKLCNYASKYIWYTLQLYVSETEDKPLPKVEELYVPQALTILHILVDGKLPLDSNSF
jgi:hypothetical protein